MIEANILSIIRNVLGKSEGEFNLDRDSALLGAIPEFDSMAVVSVLTIIEEEFGIVVDDDELDAEVFESFGSLCDYVGSKL